MPRTPLAVVLLLSALVPSAGADDALSLTWAENILTISGPRVPGGPVKILYLEAYCRPGSTDRDWHETVIPHKAKLVEAVADGSRIRLRDELVDGVVVEHEIRAKADEVDFRVKALNPTDRPSQAHWAQPCLRVDGFTGVGPDRKSEAYLKKSFIFLDGRPAMMPTELWATKARYVPGQVWCPDHVDRNDVNPRPLSSLVPSSGLIGCYSGDGKSILATAWEPYQELFQGVILCLHSDFRIAGLAPGESKTIRGKLYITPADLPALVKRYESDFPEHRRSGGVTPR